MKQKHVLLLSAIALLALSACNNASKSSSNKSQQPVDKHPFDNIPGPVVEPEVNLTDAMTPNMEISFNDVEDNCMINPKAKTYIDAMEEQEKTLDRPYHFSSLYGPDDYKTLAAASDKGDGTTYKAEETGGVDVCQILSRNDYDNDCKNYPIQLKFADNGLSSNAKVKFWSTEDNSDMREVKVTVSGGVATASLDNLYRAKKYRVQVVDGDQVSQGFEFKTGDYPRTITMGGVHNVRDIGGFMTSYGVRTNQGLMYRGYYIDDKSGGHGVNYSAEVQRVQEEVMKIGLEIDLQKASETNGRTASALNSDVTPCDYKCRTLISYENFLGQESYQNLPEVFHDVANSDNKHIYFHCWGGADRTGMLAFFINALCGVSYTDLIEDFELTTQTNNKRCHMHNSSSAHYAKFMNAFLNQWEGFDPNKTVNENIENWLLEVPEDKDGNKVDPQDIERIREIMLPGYAEGKLNADTLIPSYGDDDGTIYGYRASGDWEIDEAELAHFKSADKDPNVICEYHRIGNNKDCELCNEGKEDQGGDNGDNDNDFTQVISHVWDVTSTKTNSDGKSFEQLKDASKGKVGLRMKQSDISSTSEATFSDGKLPSDGKTVTYQFTAPKAGVYQLVMNGRVGDASYKLSQRGITIKLNGVEVPIDGADRDGGLVGTGDNDFVMCPSITLTGNEDTLTVACKNYRIAFNQSAYLVLAEH